MLDLPGYRVLGTLRATGSNVLLHAVREADGVPVVLKTPRASSPGAHETARYRREFTLLQRLRGVPGVVTAWACERLHGRPVLVLEPVAGAPLSSLTGRPMPLPDFLHLARSLVSTLAEVHRHDVIHKDLKPSNILVEPSGEARLIDFGVATLQQVDPLEAAPEPLLEGTPAYMSPEQTGRMNRALDHRTDFYSLGMTFYELLTGRAPFQAKNALEWFHVHMAHKPRPPHESNPEVPPALSAVVMKLLAKVAEERYQSAEGLLADLERCREGLAHGALEPFVLGTQDTPRRFQLPRRLYGRQAPLASLFEALERVALTGTPEWLLVSGYSGVGKSSLVHELYAPVVRLRGFLLSGGCEPFQRDIPYVALAQALRGLVRQLLAGSEEELVRWREQINRVWEGEGQVLVDLVPALEVLVGSQPALPQLPAHEAQQRFLRVVRQFLSVFSTRERPLVVFLDDLQWADASTLKLLERMLTRPDSPPVLWIGAWRDNEVGPTHPLVPVVEQVRTAGARITRVQLEPLSTQEVEQLVADTLPGASREVVAPLAALAQEKTRGNPSFLLRLLVALHQDGLLVRDPAGGWRWDEEGVRLRDYSSNVVDFLVGKLRQFPPDTQHLLALAACAGSVFSLQTLSHLAGLPDAGDVERRLEPAHQEGLVARVGPEMYRFLHDRLQQEARSLRSPEECEQIHLSIGRLLLETLSPAQVKESLFEVVSHLNAGLAWMTDPVERHQLARLNAEAGTKAQAALAARPALTYFTTAFSLIPGEPWETDPGLAFQLRLAQARAELMIGGGFSRAQALIEELRPRAHTRTELVALYALEENLHIATGRVMEGLGSMLECLELLGMPVPPTTTWEEARAAHDEVWTLLGERSIEGLVELPPMTDPDMKLAVGVLSRLFVSNYFRTHAQLLLILSRLVALVLRHGFVEDAAVGCAWFGVFTGWFFQRHYEGLAFGRLALAQIDRHGLAAPRAGVLIGLQTSSYWVQPLARAQEYVQSGLQQAQRSGYVASAAYCGVFSIINRLAMGHPLDEVHEEVLARGELLRETGLPELQEQLLITQRYVQRLRGPNPPFQQAEDDADERAFRERVLAQRNPSTRRHYWLTRVMASFLSGAHDDARRAADQLAEYLPDACGHLDAREGHFFRALCLTACLERAASPEQRREWLGAIERHYQQLGRWAELCPENFLALERLVFAERARLDERTEEATRAYEEAIQAARQSGAPQFAGIAGELAANFWRARHAPLVAHAFAREALTAYRQWGARAKARQLESQWPRLVSTDAYPELPATTASTNVNHIDVLSVVKAQQAISGEIVLERLVMALMRTALENAGAQRGALLLPEGDSLAVAALFHTTQEGTLVASGGASTELPWSLLSYVRRTREHVLIGDASLPHAFSADPYLARAAARSVLCLPLLRGERFSGALYLENDLATNAFSPARLALLGHLASQAAVSIENARLYADVQRAKAELRQANDELERRVEERTRELKQAQARLVDTAREVGMAEVAANVLHSVGNVLTSAVINLGMMRTAVGSLRVGRLKQAAALLAEHREVPDFLTRDSRGGHLPDYLVALGEDLMGEQTRLMEDMEEMNRHLEHIRAIVQVQQTYARNSLMTEECELAQLVDDALRIQMAELRRHGVTVHRELQPVPRVHADKHKVLQILINLISNAKYALDAVPERRRNLRVRLSADEHTARIQVEDDGVGIAPELAGNLFTHGFTTRKDGHGFGLHASALAARMLKGRLSLESEGPGMGAVATLELPLRSVDSP